MPKPNLYSMPRKPDVRRTFEYSDAQGSLSMELRRLPGAMAYKVASRTRELVRRFITGDGMPGGKPVGLPPMGSPPRTIKTVDLDSGLLENVATVEMMQTAAEGDLDNRYTPEDLIALAFDWESAWWALQVFVRELGEDPKPDASEDPENPKSETAQRSEPNGTTAAESPQESTNNIGG